MKLTIGKSYYKDSELGEDINESEKLKKFVINMVNAFVRDGKVTETNNSLKIVPSEKSLELIRSVMLEMNNAKVTTNQLKDMVVEVVSGNLTCINVREHVIIDNDSTVYDPRYSEDPFIKLYYTVSQGQGFELSPRERELELLRINQY